MAQSRNWERYIDILAIGALFYPVAYALWLKLVHKGADLVAMLGCAGMLIILPAMIWLSIRHTEAPPGTYPIMDRFFNNLPFRVFCFFCAAIVWMSVLSIKSR
jgi:hypothetical protein